MQVGEIILVKSISYMDVVRDIFTFRAPVKCRVTAEEASRHVYDVGQGCRIMPLEPVQEDAIILTTIVSTVDKNLLEALNKGRLTVWPMNMVTPLDMIKSKRLTKA